MCVSYLKGVGEGGATTARHGLEAVLGQSDRTGRGEQHLREGGEGRVRGEGGERR